MSYHMLTASGQVIIIDDCDIEKFDHTVRIYKYGSGFKVWRSGQAQTTLMSYIFGGDSKRTYLFKDSSTDYTRDNIIFRTKSESFRDRKNHEVKFKGVPNRGGAVIVYAGKQCLHMTLPYYKDHELAVYYNRVLDYLEIDGYRNPVENDKIVLLDRHKEYIQRKLGI